MLFAPEKARHPGLPRKPAARAANLLSARNGPPERQKCAEKKFYGRLCRGIKIAAAWGIWYTFFIHRRAKRHAVKDLLIKVK